MVELWLNYTDPAGEVRRAAIDRDRFTIGRHSENDLSIVDPRLSRDHALIERSGDVFVLTDRLSSNGTHLNGEHITGRTSINDGDKISFGGFDAVAEITGVTAPAEDGPNEAANTAVHANEPVIYPATVETGIPKAVFIIAPILGVLMLIVIGAVIYLGSGPTRKIDPDPDDFDDPPKGRSTRADRPTPNKPGDVLEVTPAGSPPASPSGTPLPNTSPVDAALSKTESNASAFMRKIAQNDPRAFIIGEPAKAVNARIRSMSSSPALAANIESARKSSTQIKALAGSMNLKPDLLAAAAIAKLGNNAGDVLQTAQSMAGTLNRLSTQLSNELGEECLVIIAAYGQGQSGDFMKMRNMLQDLATKMPDLARDIRTIWFLKKQGKISDAEYDLALRFLAVGTVAQNPKDFGVNAEALRF